MANLPPPLGRVVLDLLGQRAAGATICPSEVARSAGGADWRPLLEPVRQAARQLAADGVIEVTQRGRVVDPGAATGPVRFRLVAPAGTNGGQ